jgi:tRNA 2-selenouridine synthase
VWIAYLLQEYYDPMYDYQIQKNVHRIALRGSHEELLEHLKIDKLP